MFRCFQVFSSLELELAEFKTITVIVMNLGQTKSDNINLIVSCYKIIKFWISKFFCQIQLHQIKLKIYF